MSDVSPPDKAPEGADSKSEVGQKNSNDSEAKKHYDSLRRMYHEPTKVRLFIYDLILWAFCVIFDCFSGKFGQEVVLKFQKKTHLFLLLPPMLINSLIPLS